MLSKLVPVVGNICESGLGLDDDVYNVVADEVDVILNSAANTTFNERLACNFFFKKNLYFLVCNLQNVTI